MLKAKVYNGKGETVKNQELNSDIFGIESKSVILHKAVEVQLKNQRRPWANTKRRDEVSGGGKKPWRQKGTGRARVGSIRSPLWRGGGIVFGPIKGRNYDVKITKQERRKALFMALSDKAKENKLILVDKLGVDKVKTKVFFKFLMNLPCKENSVLVIYPKADEKLMKSMRNIKSVQAVFAKVLNVYDILRCEWLLMPTETLDIIEKTYSK